MSGPMEISWFAALCDDDYEYLGVPEPALRSSWEHCRDITLTADRNGFDNILLPSGYDLGIDSVDEENVFGDLIGSYDLDTLGDRIEDTALRPAHCSLRPCDRKGSMFSSFSA